MNMRQEAHLRALFKASHGREAELTAYAPGRVNLMGDHTDYNAGYVLPVALNFGTRVLAARRHDNQINIIAADLAHQRVSFELTAIDFDSHAPWSNYVRGTLMALMTQFEGMAGADLLVSGNVPRGAGLSSSASFEMAILKAFAGLYELPLTGRQAALLGQAAENDFVGCQCGIMDQWISALGKREHAMLLDCRDLTHQYAPIPAELSIMIVDSNVSRTLVSSEYNARRRQCEAAAHFFGKASLRELSLAELTAAGEALDEVLFRRARHVISENHRALAALEALNLGDVERLSRLMSESHASLREDFEVTTPELDALVDILSAVLGGRGGARMTGGGFGGCVVALVPICLVEEAEAAIFTSYPAMTGLAADIYICTADNGAFISTI